MTKNNQRLHAIVHGRVQGVGFRYFVIEQVRGMEITGWVRNRFNGTVEVLAEGSKADLEQLLQALHRGSRSSNVTLVKTDWFKATGEFSSFSTRHTI
jgi:acylphosphatase